MKTFRLVAALCVAFLLLFPASSKAQIAGITPCAGGTLAVSGTSSNVQLSGCGPVAIVYNISAQEAFYAIGTTSAAAATAQSSSTTAPVANQMSIPGNQFVVLQISQEAPPFLAAITSTSTTTLRIVQGYAQP